MKKLFFTSLITTALFTSLLTPVSSIVVYAANAEQYTGPSFSGDSLCGKNNSPCLIVSDGKKLYNRIAGPVILIGSALLLVFFFKDILMGFWYKINGNPNAMSAAGAQAGRATLAFIVILLLISGAAVAIGKAVGISPSVLNPFTTPSASQSSGTR
jgi:hypothetical protein